MVNVHLACSVVRAEALFYAFFMAQFLCPLDRCAHSAATSYTHETLNLVIDTFLSRSVTGPGPGSATRTNATCRSQWSPRYCASSNVAMRCAWLCAIVSFSVLWTLTESNSELDA